MEIINENKKMKYNYVFLQTDQGIKLEKRLCLLEGHDPNMLMSRKSLILFPTQSTVLSAPLQTSERIASDCIFVLIRNRKEILVNRERIIVSQSSLNAFAKVKQN